MRYDNIMTPAAGQHSECKCWAQLLLVTIHMPDCRLELVIWITMQVKQVTYQIQGPDAPPAVLRLQHEENGGDDETSASNHLKEWLS